jgi:biopolymer transport protein ExbD
VRRRRLPPLEDVSVDLTPMLDVVFILLIFFIVTASFVKESGLEIRRQYAASAETQDTGTIFVAISPAGDVWIDKRRIDVRAVRANVERLHAENPNGGVVIQADADSKNGVLVQVLDAVRLAGVTDVSIAAEVDR